MDGTEHKCNMIEVQEFVQNITQKKMCPLIKYKTSSKQIIKNRTLKISELYITTPWQLN